MLKRLEIIKSMACDTPVIAYPFGSVPEVMIDGETGYMVNNKDQAVGALKLIERFEWFNYAN